MANEKFTQLPTVTNASLNDIICAVQAGVSVQETLGQVIALATSGLIQSNAGNPNGAVAGTAYSFCWDTTNNLLWICTTSGSTSTAVWKTFEGTPTNGQLLIGSTGAAPVLGNLTAGTNITISNSAGGITISASGSGGFSWNQVTISGNMASNNGYITNSGSLITLALPAASNVGDELSIIGKGAGGWSISQATGQLIHIGNLASTSGASGSVASTNQYDTLDLVCTVANTTWTAWGGPQGNLTIV